ncbi:MAG: hypothetical protein R3Y07_08000 [Eubacteriales bacterium]
MSLFRTDIPPKCTYCANSHPLTPQQVVCRRKGIMSVASECKYFRYDPMRRVPPRPKKADFSGYNKDDFTL